MQFKIKRLPHLWFFFHRYNSLLLQFYILFPEIFLEKVFYDLSYLGLEKLRRTVTGSMDQVHVCLLAVSGVHQRIVILVADFRRNDPVGVAVHNEERSRIFASGSRYFAEASFARPIMVSGSFTSEYII